MFDQNYRCGGYQPGLYDLCAHSPTATNWTRQSQFEGPTVLNEKWRLELEDTLVHSSPVVGINGEIYFGSGSGNLYCIAEKGEILWKRRLNGCLESPVLGQGEIIYIGSRNNTFYSINKFGDVLWEYQTEYPISFSPSIDSEGTIYLVSNDELHAISSGGKEKWVYKCEGAFWSSIVLGLDGNIIAGANGHLFALDKDRNHKWTVQVGASFASSPILTDTGHLIVEAFINEGKRLLSIDTNDGRINWTVKPERGGFSTSPTLGLNKMLYAGTNIFELFAITVDGTIKWRQKVEGFMYHPPLISANEVIYIATSKEIAGKLYTFVYSLNKDGSINSVFRMLNGTATSLSLGRNGILYAVAGYTDKNKLTVLALS